MEDLNLKMLKGVIKAFVWWISLFVRALVQAVRSTCYRYFCKMTAGSLWQCRRAVSAVGVVLTIVAAYVAGILLPTAIVALSNSTAYSGADSNVVVIATVLLPILVIVGLALRFISTR